MTERKVHTKRYLYLLMGLIAGAAVAFYFVYKDDSGLKEKIKKRVEGLKAEVNKWGHLPQEEISYLIDKARQLLDDLESYLKDKQA